MRNPASNSGRMSEGYGAYTCEFGEYDFFFTPYVEIQVHPDRVRIDVHFRGRRQHSEWFPESEIRSLCVALCVGGDCVGQLADAVEESRRMIPICGYLRKCGEKLAGYYRKKS